MSRCSPYLPAALPSLSMASSATDPNGDTAAPHEPDWGVRRPGSHALRLVPFFGVPKWRPSELRDGRRTGLEWPLLLNCLAQQPTERWCRWGGGALERRCKQAERVGEDVCPLFWVANGVMKKKKQIERAMGPWIAMGSCCMGWDNNQPKVGRIFGVYLGEAARSAETIGEDVVTPSWPSDYGAKNKWNEIRRGFRRLPVNDFTQQPTKLSRAQWWTNIGEDAWLSGNAGGGAFDRSGAGWVGGGENIQKNRRLYKINYILSRDVKELNKILHLSHWTTHRDEVAGCGRLSTLWPCR